MGVKGKHGGGKGGAGAQRTGFVVWVGRVPAPLCASEIAVRDLFSEYGMLLSVTIRHNFVDMSTAGFMYLEYASQQEAANAVAAVAGGHVGLTGSDDGEVKRSSAMDPAALAEMQAALALRRGTPSVDVDEAIRDLLTGRRHASQFSQQSQMDNGEDEDELILQSLSQHSLGGSQQRKRRRKGSRRLSQLPSES